MINHYNRTAKKIATSNINARFAPGIYVMDVAGLTQDRFAIAADDLVAWLASMNIAKRVLVAPFDWSDTICETWRRHAFEVLRVSADNDNVSTSAREIASRYARIYVATSPADLIDWAEAISDTSIFVACVRSAADTIPAPVKAKAVAVYHMRRFMFPLAPALARAA